MSIAKKYYTDTAQVQVYKGINDRGDTIYEQEVSVPCRFDYVSKEILDNKAQKLPGTAVMLCSLFIAPLSIVKDSLNNCFTVKSCECIRRVSGEIDHYEVML